MLPGLADPMGGKPMGLSNLARTVLESERPVCPVWAEARVWGSLNRLNVA